MPAGPAFLHPPTSFSTRLCFIDFDGERALAASRQIGLDNALGPEFVGGHCSRMVDAMDALCSWVEQYHQ